MGEQSTVKVDFVPGECQPVGISEISAMSLDTTGLTPAAGGTIDLLSATITWTTPGYAWLVVQSSIKYQCEGGPIKTVTRTTNYFFTVLKVELENQGLI